MKWYVFDPRRLRGSAKQQERDGYSLAGRMLRDHLGGDLLAELQRRIRRDPVLRAMLRAAAADLTLAAAQIKSRLDEDGG